MNIKACVRYDKVHSTRLVVHKGFPLRKYLRLVQKDYIPIEGTRLNSEKCHTRTDLYVAQLVEH